MPIYAINTIYNQWDAFYLYSTSTQPLESKCKVNMQPEPTVLRFVVENNIDATCKTETGKRNRTTLPRLTAPIPASMGPMRSQHDRSTIMQKCDAAWHVDDGDGNAVARDGPSQGGMKIMLCFLRAHWLRPMPYNR